MRLIAVGRLRAGPEADLFQRYAQRLRPGLVVREIPEASGSAGEIRKREGEALLSGLGARDVAAVLDQGGEALDSEAFAALLGGWARDGKQAAFLIGGAEGLAPAVTARAGFVLSLGKMTWPHMLVRVMLAEQIYRSQSMATGHPYHRGFRP